MLISDPARSRGGRERQNSQNYYCRPLPRDYFLIYYSPLHRHHALLTRGKVCSPHLGIKALRRRQTGIESRERAAGVRSMRRFQTTNTTDRHILDPFIFKYMFHGILIGMSGNEIYGTFSPLSDPSLSHPLPSPHSIHLYNPPSFLPTGLPA